MESYEQKYKAALEWMQGMYGGLHGKTKEEAEKYFPELAESEDERIRKRLIDFFEDWHENRSHCWGIAVTDILAWLEKQGKPMWTDEDSLMIDSIIDTIKWLEGKGATDMKIDWLKQLKQRMGEHEKQGEPKLASSAKTCKNDTLLDLLHKIPSYITVDGIFYHFMLSKTSLSYMAFYEGEGEGGGKIIFWMTGEPIELLTAMLEKLKEKGMLE